MQHHFLLRAPLRLCVLAVTLLSLLMSCNEQGGKAKLTHDDSLAICEAIINQGDTSKPQLESHQKYVFEKDDNEIPEPTARSYHKAYLSSPIPGIVDNNGNLIRGFYISATDINNIKNKLVNGARVYFGKAPNGSYRLILVGVKNDLSNDLSYIADEFLPCPTSCPGDNNLPTLPEATRRAIYRSDLNWHKTVGNTEVMKNFNNTEVVRQ